MAIKGDILERILVAIILKKCPYGNIVVLYVLYDKFWPCFETVRFWKAILHRYKRLKKKLL